MEELEKKIVEAVMENLHGGLGASVILDNDNPLDEETPTGVPLQIVGIGMGARCIDYPNIPGFDQIQKTDDDPYYILADGVRHYVVRQNIDHELMFSKSAVGCAIDRAAYDIVDIVEEHRQEW